MIWILTLILKSQGSVIGIPDKYPTVKFSTIIFPDEYLGSVSLYAPLKPHVALGNILSDQSNSSFLYQVQFSNSYILIAYCQYDLSKEKILHFYEMYLDGQLKQQNVFEIDPLNYEGTFTYHYFNYNQSESILLFVLINNNLIQTANFSNFQLVDNTKSQILIGGSFANLELTSFPGYLQFELGNSFIDNESSFYENYISRCSQQNEIIYQSVFDFSIQDPRKFTNSPLVYLDYSLQFWIKLLDMQYQQDGELKIFQINQQQRQSNDIEMGQDAVRIELKYISETEVEIYAFYYSYTYPAINLDKDYIFSLTQKSLIGKMNVNLLLKWHVIQIIFLEKILTIKILIPNGNKLIFESQSIKQFSFSQFQFLFGKDSTIQFQAQIAFLTFYNCYQELDETINCHFSCEICDGPFEYNCLSCPIDSYRIFNEQDNTCHCGPWTLEQNISQCFQQNSQIQYELLSNTIGYDQFEPEIICSYGYFLYNNQCFQCPSSGDKFRQCYQCLLDWKNWVYSGECYTDYQFFSLFFFVDEELYKCDYCQIFCSKPSQLCNLHQKEHLNKPTYITCQYHFDYKNKICLPPRSYQLKKFTCNSRCTDCQNGNFCNQCQEDNDTQLLNFRDCQPCTIEHCLQCFSYTYIDGIPVSTLNTDNLDSLEINDDFYIGCALCEEGFIYDQSQQMCLLKQNIVVSCQNYYINENGKFICLSTTTSSFDDGIEIQNCQNFIQNCQKCIKYTTQKIICSQCQEGFYINVLQMCDPCPKNSVNCYIDYLGQSWPLKIQPFYISFYEFTEFFSLGTLLSSLIVICQQNYFEKLDDCQPIIKNIFCQTYDNNYCATCINSKYDLYPVDMFELQQQCFQCFHQCQICIPKSVNGDTIYFSMVHLFNQTWQDTKCIKTDSTLNYIQQSSGYVKPIQKGLYRYKTIYNIVKSSSALNSLWKSAEDIDYLNLIQPDDILIDTILDDSQANIYNYYFSQISQLKNVNITLNNKKIQRNYRFFDFNRITIINTTFIITNLIQQNLIIQSQYGVDVVLENVTVSFINSVAYQFYLKIDNCTGLNIQNILFSNFQGDLDSIFLINLNQVTSININIYELTFINCTISNGFIFQLQSNNAKLINLSFKNITIINCTMKNIIFIELSDSILTEQFQMLEFSLISSIVDNFSIFTNPRSNKDIILNQLFIKNTLIANSSLFQTDLNLNLFEIIIDNSRIMKSDIFVLSDIKAQNNLIIENVNFYKMNFFESSFLSVLSNFNQINITNILILNSCYDSQEILHKSLFQLRANQIFIFNYSSFDSNLYHLKTNFSMYLSLSNIEINNMNQQYKLAHYFKNDSQISNSQLLSCNNVLRIDIINMSAKYLLIQDLIFINIEEFSLKVQILMKQINFDVISIEQTNKQSAVSLIGILLQQNSFIQLSDITINQIFGIQRTDNLLFYQIQIILIQSELSYVKISNFQMQNNYIANSSTALLAISSYRLEVENFTNFNSNKMNDNIYGNLLQEYSQLSLDEMSYIFQIKSYGSLFKIKSVRLSIVSLNSINSQSQIGGLAYIVLNQDGNFYFSDSTIKHSLTQENVNSQGGVFYLDASLGNLYLKIQNVLINNCFSFYQGGFLFLRPSIYQNQIFIDSSQFIGVVSMTRSFLSTEFLSNPERNVIRLNNVTILCSDFDIVKFTQHYPFVSSDSINPDQAQEGMLYLKNCNLHLNNIFIYLQTAFEPIFYINSDSLIEISNCKINFQTQSDQFLIKILGPSLPKQFKLKIFNVEIIQIKLHLEHNLFTENLLCTTINFKELKINSFLIKIPSILNNNCLLSFWIHKKVSIHSLLNIESSTIQANNFYFQNLMISQIENSNYQQSIINIITKGQLNANFQYLSIINCNCNQQSCMQIQSEKQNQNSQIIVNKSKFLNNINNANGTLQIKQINQIIQDTSFINNSGISVGAALVLEPDNLQDIYNTYFFNNSALQFSGAVFSTYLNASIIHNFFLQNEANQGMATFGLLPWKLSLQVLNTKTNTIFSYQTSNSLIITFPSGQLLKDYQIFNIQNLSYYFTLYLFKIVIINQFDEKQFNFDLINICQMSNSFVFRNLSNASNQSIIESLSFDQFYQINLDSITFIKNPYEKTYIKSTISCPQILQVNHSITFYINTYKCQRGEILYKDQCLKCNGNQGYYSFDPLIGSCTKINTNQVKNNTENQLELYPGYWRPFIFSSEISYCHNNIEICLGGWKAAEISCQIGHIGALCEECDLYNIRGDGSFSKSQNYQCSNCGDLSVILLKLFVIFIWIMLQINLAVKNTQMQNEKFLMLKTMQKSYYYILFKNYQEQSGTLFKLVINYFQIISLFSIVDTSFDLKITQIFSFIGNSTETLSYDLNCYLYKLSSLGIIYLNSFYVILMPIIYFFCYCILAYCLSIFKLGTFTEESKYCSLFYLTLTTKANYINQLILLSLSRKISGIDWISSNVSYEYRTTIHFRLLKLYIIPALLIFSILIPLVLAINFHSKKSQLNLHRFKRKYGYLFNDYKNKAYYWELIKLEKNEVLVLFYVMFQETEALGLLLQMFLLFLYQNILNIQKPYSLEQLNKFEQQIITMVQLLLFFSLSQNLASEQQFELSIISKLCKTIFLVILIWICAQKLLNNFLNKYYKVVDQIKLKIINIITDRKLVNNPKRLLKILELRQVKLDRVKKNFLKIKRSLKQAMSSPQFPSSPLRTVPQYTLNSSQDVIIKSATTRSLI